MEVSPYTPNTGNEIGFTMKKMNEGEALIIAHFKDRIERNRNNLVLMVGETGLSKSLSSLRIAELMHPDPFITLSPKEVLKEGPKQSKGEVMVYDDIGSTLGARDSSMITNRVISYYAESFRFLNTTLIMSAPNIGMVDLNLRRLLHLVFEMIQIDYLKEKALADLWTYYIDPVTDIPEKKHPTYWGEDGPIEVTGIGIERPSRKLELKYEAIKKKSIDRRWQELEERAGKIEGI